MSDAAHAARHRPRVRRSKAIRVGITRDRLYQRRIGKPSRLQRSLGVGTDARASPRDGILTRAWTTVGETSQCLEQAVKNDSRRAVPDSFFSCSPGRTRDASLSHR
jgi:hypothetical protein